MTRTDDDTWDITQSVGATALAVAAARAAETESPQPLFHDPFARVFLDAVGEGTWSLFDRAVAVDADQELAQRVQSLWDFVASRTAFIDDFFAAAAEAGIRQVVILASGLDSRAWRLPWPDGTRVYELDLPKVLDFKSSTLRAHGAIPTAQRIEVSVDLRQDWPTALRQKGFDQTAPTAWSVEGLLRYLPSESQDLLFDRIQELSARGSRIAVNAPTEEALNPDHRARERELTHRMRTALGTREDHSTPSVDELTYAEERSDVVDWLVAHGWKASSTTVPEAVAQYRRRPLTSPDGDAVPSVFIAGELLDGQEES